MTTLLLAMLLLAGGGKSALSARHSQWLNQEVVYIITQSERDEFLSLESEAERASFIERFWTRRDPDPATQENEFRTAHAARIRYANERFHDGKPGWRTARGRTYIM